MQQTSHNLILLLFIGLLLLTACTSKKREALNQLENFTEDVEKNGASWSASEWEQKYEDLKEIRTEIYKYNYDETEKAEIGRLEGRCVSAMANHVSGGLLHKIIGVGTELKGAINGLLEGIDQSSSEDN